MTAEKEIQRKHFPATFGLEELRLFCLPSCPGSASLDTDTLAHTHSPAHIKTSTNQQRHARVHRPTSTWPCAPTQDFQVCDDPREPHQPSTRTHLTRTPTRPSLPSLSRQPHGRARGQRAPPHGRPYGPPLLVPRLAQDTDGSRSCVGKAWVVCVSVGSAKVPAVRSQTPGTKARRKWRAPRGPPPSDTN